MKAFKLKTLATLITGLMLLGTVSAVEPQPEKAASMESDNIEISQGGQVTTVDKIFQSLNFLSAIDSKDNVEPGGTIEFDSSVDVQQSFNLDGSVSVVEIYKCQDSSCDNGELLEAETEFNEIDFELNQGNSYSWKTTYDVPQEEGYYAATSYMSDGSGNVYTDSPEHIFTVGSVDNGGTSSSPDIKLSRSPNFNINEEANTVVGSLGIKNIGDGDMTQNDIVEMQVRPSGEGPLSFTSAQQVCDQDYPNNVHKEYSIESGDSESVTLSAGAGLEDGESYTVYFLTRDACQPDNDRVEPLTNSYNAGTFTFNDPSQDTDNDSQTEPQDVVEVSKPELSYEDGVISTEIQFKNQGGDMPDEDIVEMQVRPTGEGPLSFSSIQQVCDPDYENHVYKDYQLDAGETDSTTLTVDEFEKTGSYTVYLLTREGCSPDNEKVDPYYNSVRAGTVDFNSEGEGWVTVVEDNIVPIALVGLGVLLVAGWFVFLRD